MPSWKNRRHAATALLLCAVLPTAWRFGHRTDEPDEDGKRPGVATAPAPVPQASTQQWQATNPPSIKPSASAPADSAPLAWTLYPRQPANTASPRETYDMTLGTDLLQSLQQGRKVTLPTPDGPLQFELQIRDQQDGSSPAVFVPGQKRTVKISGLNSGSGKPEVLDLTYGPAGGIGQIESGDQLYLFRFRNDGRGEMVKMPPRMRPRPLVNE